jgi:hypothetical protein
MSETELSHGSTTPPPSIWVGVPIVPITYFAALRTVILAKQQTRFKRTPKWRFGYNDLAIELQPKDSVKWPFRGWTIIGDERVDRTKAIHTLTWLERSQAGLRAEVHFDIAVDAGGWRCQHRGSSTAPAPSASRDERETLRRRAWTDTLAALADLAHRDLAGVRFLGHACSCCGRALTDPVSMSRKIGPECWSHQGLQDALPTLIFQSSVPTDVSTITTTTPEESMTHQPEQDSLLHTEKLGTHAETKARLLEEEQRRLERRRIDDANHRVDERDRDDQPDDQEV